MQGFGSAEITAYNAAAKMQCILKSENSLGKETGLDLHLL